MKKILSLIKQGLYNQGEVSSKRIVMYTFATMAVFMIHIEAFFNLVLIYKYVWGDADTLEFKMVFDGAIYGYVFGTITAMAAVNGFGKQTITPKEKNV